MRLTVNPNRMELLRLKKRVVIARKGHKLLQDKQDELMRRFLSLVEECKSLREDVEAKLVEACSYFLACRSTMSKKALKDALLYPREVVRLVTSTTTVMNMRVPKISLEGKSDPYSYGLVETSGELDIALGMFIEILPLAIKLAESEETLILLAEEIERTRRRVNALEYVLIPNLEETIKYIGMKLSEMERSNLTRLMRIKEQVSSEAI